jgi:hypothetical protein
MTKRKKQQKEENDDKTRIATTGAHLPAVTCHNTQVEYKTKGIPPPILHIHMPIQITILIQVNSLSRINKQLIIHTIFPIPTYLLWHPSQCANIIPILEDHRYRHTQHGCKLLLRQQYTQT